MEIVKESFEWYDGDRGSRRILDENQRMFVFKDIEDSKIKWVCQNKACNAFVITKGDFLTSRSPQHSCVKYVTPDQYRALKIENSVMKKCHEENMSDAHQVYIKILEAIGENGLMKVVRSTRALTSQYKRMIENIQPRSLDKKTTPTTDEDFSHHRKNAKNIETSSIELFVKESLSVDVIYQKVILQLTEAGLYEARTRKKALLEQIYKAVTKYRSENEIVQRKEKRKKADIESIIELEKALVPEEELFSCYVCTKTFLFDVDRRKHLRYHEREARFLRSGSDYSKPVFEEFLNEIKTPEKGGTHSSTFSCGMCTNTFISEAALELHKLYTHEKDKEFVYNCVFCDKPFTNYSSFKNHENNHNKTKDFACDICGKAFFHDIHLRRHILKHTGEQPHSCDICGLKFSHLNSLKRHGLIHQKDYKCKICGKQFNDKSILKIHLVMHEKELPFQCSICNKGFKHECNLNTHMLSHQRKKCSECNKKLYEHEIEEHMITKHNKHESEDPDDDFNNSTPEHEHITIQEESLETISEENNSTSIDVEEKYNEDSHYIKEELSDVDVKYEPFETNPSSIQNNYGHNNQENCDINIKDEPIEHDAISITEMEHIEVNPDIKLEIKNEPME